MDVSEDSGLSIYNSSFKQKCQSERRQLVTSRDKETTAQGIGQYTPLQGRSFVERTGYSKKRGRDTISW